MTPFAISKRTSIPIEHIKAGIEVLEKPDPYSRTPDEEGRRIVRLDEHRPWGWYLVNHSKYKGLQDSDTVREQNRIRKKRQRNKVTECHGMSRNVTECHGMSRHTDTDTDTDTDKKKDPCPRKFSDEDLSTSKWMFTQILQINHGHKPPKFETWAVDIRLMRDRDKHTDAEIREVFAWANNDPFWRKNILSPATLRKQWDRLKIQTSSMPVAGTNKQTAGKIGRALDAIQRHEAARALSPDNFGNDPYAREKLGKLTISR